MSNGKRTFVRITNNDIFDKIESMHEDLIKQNGKIKLNRWIATTALSIGLFLVGWKIW